MTGSTELPAWDFRFTRIDTLPPLAWIARLAGHAVEVRCGTSVRCTPEGFFEGTRAGPAELASVAEAANVFGSGIVVRDDVLCVVPPSHMLEGVFVLRRADTLLAANSLVGLLVAADLELKPGTPYPNIFGQALHGLAATPITIPTTGEPVSQHYYENIVVHADLSTEVRQKPREHPYESFADYRDRLVERVRSCFANAPDYEPVATISSGYDSTATSAVAAQAGCRRAVTFRDGQPWHGHRGTNDSGELAAAALGLNVSAYDRLAYLESDDCPEAEFLATGMSGEDAPFRSFEMAVRGSLLVSGFWGGGVWRRVDRPRLRRQDHSGTSLGEFRLRNDFVHLPIPFIGGTEKRSLLRLTDAPEMRPYDTGTRYEEPIARRLAEEAGVPRGAFGMAKRAASQRIHVEGLAGLSRSSRAAIERFAGPQQLAALPSRSRIGRRHRLAIRLAHALRVPGLVRGIEEQRRSGVHIEATLGSILLRWAVGEVRPRYRDARPP